MSSQIYENYPQLTSPRGSPIPQYSQRRPVHSEYLSPCVPCSPPESAWKNYEMQELYDELIKLRRKDEANNKWRQEVEKKWKESQEEVRELKGEVKRLKEDNTLLLTKVYGLPLATNPIPVCNHTAEQAVTLNCKVRSKSSEPMPRGQTPIEIESQKMQDYILSLNLVIQQLNEDNTGLLKERTKGEEESKKLRDYGKRQKTRVHELTQKNQEISIENLHLNNKVLNCQNENANLNMIVKENLTRIK